MRRKTVRLKLNTIKSEFHGKNVLLIDDSIVRGTTSMELVQMARDAGAKKVLPLPASSSIFFPTSHLIMFYICLFSHYFNICIYSLCLHLPASVQLLPSPFPLPFLFPLSSASYFPLKPLPLRLSYAGILCKRGTPSTLQQRVRY